MAKILIADDDDILVDVIRYRLEGAGHTVSSATDGAAAYAQACQAPPDLMVLDAMMPMESGIEVLAKLRRTAATAQIPVIMLTARKGEADIVAALDAGAADYLTKPFIPSELLSRIALQLRRANRNAT